MSSEGQGCEKWLDALDYEWAQESRMLLIRLACGSSCLKCRSFMEVTIISRWQTDQVHITWMLDIVAKHKRISQSARWPQSAFKPQARYVTIIWCTCVHTPWISLRMVIVWSFRVLKQSVLVSVRAYEYIQSCMHRTEEIWLTVCPKFHSTGSENNQQNLI